MSKRSRVTKIGVACLLATGAFAIAVDAWIGAQASDACFEELEHVPVAPVALVLGCAPRLADGRANLYFARRIDAAVELYRSGRVRALIASGDNRSNDYDEPTAMKAALVAAGVPEEHVYCDFAGFRTLDSVARAELVFGQRRIVVVSQRFHVERAVYLARARGIEAFGYCARSVGGSSGRRMRVREVVARAAALIDAHVLHTEPRLVGPRVEVDLGADPDG